MTHLLVDTENGLRIVRATAAAFTSSVYSVQFVGTEAECRAERARLLALE